MKTDTEIVAEKARDTFEAIKKLRKEIPSDRKWQRDKLELEIKRLEDAWWEDVKMYMLKGENDPPFRKEE